MIQYFIKTTMEVYGVQSTIYDMMFIPAKKFKKMFITNDIYCAENPEYNKDGRGEFCNDSIMQSYSVTHIRSDGMYYGTYKAPMLVLGIYCLVSLKKLAEQGIKHFKEYVATTDVDRLWSILEKIHNGALKNETDALILYGSGNNGKTTLAEVMRQLNPNVVVHEGLIENKHTGISIICMNEKPNVDTMCLELPNKFEHVYSLTQEMIIEKLVKHAKSVFNSPE